VKRRIVFVADFFDNDLVGGAELNDGVLIRRLTDLGYKIKSVKSSLITEEFLKSHEDFFYIISNFIGLTENCKRIIADECEYIIYEHDHKYLISRDPSVFCSDRSSLKEMSITAENIINSRFYTKAKTVVCLSEVCKKILEELLNIKNVVSIGTSLWSENRLSKIESLLSEEKSKGCMVLNSANQTKNTDAGVKYCRENNIPFDLVGGLAPDDFLKAMAQYKTLVYIPKVLETFCRLVVEAKMLKCEVKTVASLIGAASETCIKLDGRDLIEEIRNRVNQAIDLFSHTIDEPIIKTDNHKIAFIGKFRKLHDEEGKARALEKLGHHVLRFDETSFNTMGMINNEMILLHALPDIVIYTKLRIPHAQRFMSTMKQNGIKTVCWVPDLYFGIPREEEVHKKTPMFQGDYIFSPDGGSQEKFKSLSINHIPLKQGIFYDSCIEKDEVGTREKKIDILFVGGVNKSIHGESRERLLNFLRDTYGDRFFWAGANNSEQYRGNDLTDLIASANIIIGDCVDSPDYWSNRLYETIGRGGFMLHPQVKGIDHHYIPGKHFDTFERNNFKQLQNKIEFYLENTAKRNTVVKEGLSHTKTHHTLTNRAAYLIERVTNGKQ
tara:strand:+ start:2625 stop:4454 length:1830 start_codon:yes stop_codon:yes gene_type:complete